MSIYLPRNLAGLSALASRDSGRYAMATVRVRDPGDGLYRAEATDGKVLAIVQGPVPEECYPLIEDADASTGAELMVSIDAWTRAFKLGDRHRPVGIALGESKLTLAVGDQSLTTPLMEGRYPNVDEVLPRQGALVTIRVQPYLLIALLKLAETIHPDGGVSLLYFGNGKPLGLATRNDQGQTFDGLLMPLTTKEK